MPQRLSDLIDLKSLNKGMNAVVEQVSDFVASANTIYSVSGGVEVTLDSTAAVDSWIILVEEGSTWATSSVTVSGDGQPLNGNDVNLELTSNTNGVTFQRTATGWNAYVHTSASSYYRDILSELSEIGISLSLTSIDPWFVSKPVITSPSDGVIDVDETPIITTSVFNDNDGSDTHASTDWQIASDSGFSTIVVQSDNDSSNLESWTVPSGNLSVDTIYYIRARHTGTTYGDSIWSAGASMNANEQADFYDAIARFDTAREAV